MAKSGLKRKPREKEESAAQARVKGVKPFVWNAGQQRVLDLLNSKVGATVNEMLIAAGSRCFVAGTKVRTAAGCVNIEDILPGDKVLSVNSETKEIENQQVLKIFHNKQGQSRKNVIFVMEDGTKIHCTEEHEIYQKEGTASAGAIARRTLENDSWHKWHVPSEQFGQDQNNELEGYRRDARNETSARCERISPNDDPARWAGQNDKSTQSNRRDLAGGTSERGRSKPLEQYPRRQPSGEYRVGNPERELGLDNGARSADNEQRGKERDEQTNRTHRGSSSGDTKIIRSDSYETVTMGGALRYKRSSSTGCSVPKELEARILNPAEIVEIVFFESTQDTYDICVAKNHNYMVTENNYLVSNSGKTFLIVSCIVTMAVKYPGSRHLIARKFFSHVKASVWLDTLPKVLELLFKDLKPHLWWNNTDYFLEFPNGSQIWLGGLDDKERVDKILGREYMTIFFNEASEIDYDTYVTVKTRLAQLIEGGKNRIFVDENPPSSRHWTKVLFVDRMDPVKRVPVRDASKLAFVQIHPWENKANISKEYLDMINDLPHAKRLRFFEGKFRDDSQNALWKSADIAKNRIQPSDLPLLKRTVVAIDPAVSSKDTSDETGIVVKGLGYNDQVYLLADYTSTYTPTEWAKKAVWAYHEWKAAQVVAEVNNGGDLVETVLRTVEGGKYVPYEGVHATRDKLTRAEPVAALSEQGLDHHVGEFVDMEDEMCSWEGKKGEKSPNRIDANVWATFALLPDMAMANRKTGGNFVAAMQSQMGAGYG